MLKMHGRKCRFCMRLYDLYYMHSICISIFFCYMPVKTVQKNLDYKATQLKVPFCLLITKLVLPVKEHPGKCSSSAVSSFIHFRFHSTVMTVQNHSFYEHISIHTTVSYIWLPVDECKRWLVFICTRSYPCVVHHQNQLVQVYEKILKF